MSLSKTRAWIAGTVVLCLLLTVAAWFLLISPKRAEAAELREQAIAQAAANDQTEDRIVELKRQFAELPRLQAELAQIRRAMPKDAALADLTRSLDGTATASAVTLMAVTPSAPIAFSDPAAVPVAPAASATPAAGETPAAPAPEIGLVEVPVTIQTVGSFTNSEKFLQGLQQQLGRDFLVKQLNVTAEEQHAEASGGKPAVVPGDVTMTITGSVFVLPDAAVAPAATATPTATP